MADTVAFDVFGDDYADLTQKAEAAILAYVKGALKLDDMSITYDIDARGEQVDTNEGSTHILGWTGHVTATITRNRTVGPS